MGARLECPDVTRLRAAIEGDLPEEEQTALERHLDTCPDCRRLIDDLSKSDDTWSDVSEVCRGDEPPPEPALERAIEAIKGGSTTGEIVTSPRQGLDSAVLGCLSPSKQPEHLGRLDHYEILAVVGAGGMGVVLRALDELLQRVVAVKVMAPQLATVATARQRFIREAKAAAAVNHDHVVTIHGVGEANGLPYLVMQFVAGGSLQEKLDKHGPLRVAETVRIGMQTAMGLAAAHAQGLVHRDVKPANILLEDAGDLASAGAIASSQRVKITDFGLARAVDDASVSQSGVVAGTPQYMAPEQAEAHAVDHRADLFSFGSVLYAMCTGQAPFRGGSAIAVLKRVCEEAPLPIRELNPDVPDWLAAIIGKLHAKNPAQRFQTAAEVGDLLGRHLDHLQRPGDFPLPPPVRVAGTRPWARTAVAIGVVAAASLAFFLWARRGADSGHEDVRPGNEARAMPFAPRPVLAPEELANLPSPLDALDPERLPAAVFALASHGTPPHTPRGLVAVLGDCEFHLPGLGPTGWMDETADGTLLAVCCGAEVVLFEIRTGAYRRRLTGLKDRVVHPAFSPDGRRLAAGNLGEHEPVIKIWDVATGDEVFTLRGHTAGVTSVAFSRDGKYLASSSFDQTIRLWDAQSGKSEKVFRGHTDAVIDVAISPDGGHLASASYDKTGRVWDIKTGQELGTLVGHRAQVHRVSFSPDGELVATSNDGALKLWDAQTFRIVRTLSTPAGWHAFTPDGRVILTAKAGAAKWQMRAFERWDPATGKQLAALGLPAGGDYYTYQLSPDAKTLYCAAAEFPGRRLVAYDATTGRPVLQQHGHGGAVNAVSISSDGRTLASAGEDHSIRLWDLVHWGAGEALPPVRALEAHTAEVLSLAFSPDGALLASADKEGNVILWDVATGHELYIWRGHARMDSCIAFSPDGRTVAAGGDDGAVRLWDVTTGRARESRCWHEGIVRATAFSPDGRLLASAGEDATVQLGEVETGQRVHAFRTGTPAVALAFTPDTKALAAICALEGRLHLWDMATGREAPLPSGMSPATGLAFHPAGRMAATTGDDGAVHFWDVTGTPLRAQVWPLLLPDGAIPRGVAFTPEGRYMAVAISNGSIYLLRLAPRGTAVTPEIQAN